MRKGTYSVTIVTTLEAQTMLARLIASVALGEEVVITDGGLPVARLVGPVLAKPTEALAEGNGPLDGEEDERPWRGVFAIESPSPAYKSGKLRLPATNASSEQEPVDIFWDRLSHSDE